MKVEREITLEDVEREIGDLGEWLPHVVIEELPAALTPLLSPPGLFGFGVISLVVGVFVYWCVSDSRKKRKGWASGRKKAKKGG